MARDKVRTRELQRALNRFTNRYLKGIGPLRVDGRKGPATSKRIQLVKYYLGFLRKQRIGKDADKVTKDFWRRLNHPRSRRVYPGHSLERARKRRARQRRHARERPPKTGVGTFDGKPVANAAIPHMRWARSQTWRGWLVSGYRSPAYSEHLCYAMCGAPQCPGRCAGRATNHAYADPLRFAIDVSDYVAFGRLMPRSPYTPHIYNALGARDPVHFSPSGR